jgi:hypothetical protein
MLRDFFVSRNVNTIVIKFANVVFLEAGANAVPFSWIA